ncbi:MAG TPA: trypsin-like peptidase domain-containing protein [Candidatus Binataceae bacterium]|nr:trypsin-like peptidase domain-containing protein [Candidatus Binataceae bacterium]
MMPRDFGAVAEALRRSTVHIRDGGSGVLWRSDGLIITNAHVARADRHRIELWDGRVIEATTAKRDPRRDLALLRADLTNASAVVRRDSSTVRAGEIAIAVGNPLGFIGALSTGVIYGHGPLRGLGRQSWVQADIRLAPGNSGGPLADAEGRMIGINTMIAGGLALAVPGNIVAAFAAETKNRASLGVTIRPVPPGLLVLEVAPDSPAARASLFPGDILTGISLDELYDAIETHDVLLLRFCRGDQRVREVAIRLAA